MRVLVATGASGGHAFPAFSFCDELLRMHPGAQLMLVMPERAFVDYTGPAGVLLRRVPVEPITASFDRRNVLAVFGLLKSTALCLLMVAQFRPQVAVGFGSLASVPALLCAWILRVPTLLHEQNVVPGKANRFLAALVDKVAVSFSESRSFFKSARRKIVYTGNPLRRRLKAVDKAGARSFFRLSGDVFTVLVTGGSQGSRRINAAAQEALIGIRQKSRLQVIHLSGRKDFQEVRKRYDAAMPDAAVFPFLEEMHYAYSAADLVISRSGATTVSEIVYFGIPAIVIPYPFARAHQEANAQVLAGAGCAIIVKDDELSHQVLQSKIENFLRRPELLARMAGAAVSLQSVNSAGLLVNAALALTR